MSAKQSAFFHKPSKMGRYSAQFTKTKNKF